MEKRYLLPKTAQYKANLHCHTTLSDGKVTPEDMKEGYKKHGYSIIAYTDHEYIVNHQDLNDENFIAITGYEYAVNRTPRPEDAYKDWLDQPCCHLNFYAKDPYMDTHVHFHPEDIWGTARDVAHTLKYAGELKHRDYNDLQSIIDAANAAGFFVCLNHPYWSLMPQEDYFHLEGLFAMEVYNTGCDMYSGHSWFDYGLLCDSKPDIAPIAADDNHNHPDGALENRDSFGGYTMICTDDFSYTGILKALENRDFYASTGIEFQEISVTDGVVHIECTECTTICPYFGGRRWWDKRQNMNGLTSADFAIPDGARYVRFLCVDERTGKMATTKPYIL